MGRKKPDKLTRRQVGRALRTTRLDQEMDLDELSDELDVSKSYLSRAEEGDVSPSLGLLVQWSRALGRETWDVLRDAGV